MNSTISVSISNDSLQLIKDVNSMYKEVDKPIEYVNGRCIIHLYPMKDTMLDGEDNLTGYMDAMLFKIVVCDVDKRIKYTREYVDSVSADFGYGTRIFKDLSTMMIFDKSCEISYGSTTFIYEKR